MSRKSLKIINARENNLKGISVDVAHDQFTVVTGLSGSGKSSFAFDTVYAEGQRRYIETFSPYTRQFFDKVKKPDLDTAQNVRPAVAIQQRTRINNSRSTVGSLTNILDYLKILWSNVSEARCPVCGKPLKAWTAETLSRHLPVFFSGKGARSFLIAARVRIVPAQIKGELVRLGTLGFSRIYNQKTSEVQLLEEAGPDDFAGQSEIIVVLDRVSESSRKTARLRDSIDQAFTISNGSVLLIDAAGESGGQYHEFFNSFVCPDDGIRIEKPKPSLFSHNHPMGACPECKGFGRVLAIDPKLCVPDPSLSVKEKALQCWAGDAARGEFKKLLAFCSAQGIPADKPWGDLKQSDREKIFSSKSREFRGVFLWFKKLERKAYKMHVRVFLSRYRTQRICGVCNGTRLKPSALAYHVHGKTMPETLSMPVSELADWISDLEKKLTASSLLTRDLKYIFSAVKSRLSYLVNLGLPYLTLERLARTLSGGETQRVNLATALGSELISTQFVLDEPSVGLHSRDTARLITALKELSSRRNSLLVVEHDLDCIYAAGNVIELGPKAGEHGGEVVYSGKSSGWKGISVNKDLILSGSVAAAAGSPSLGIRKATARNLKNFDLEIPLSLFVCLTGVSGSGKSTLVSEVIKASYDRFKGGDRETVNENIAGGFGALEQVLLVDQNPLSKTPRANIATYSGIWDEIRQKLAASDEAKTRALSKSAFSFNVDGGRCPACKGAGFITEDMQFLSDVYVPCEVCLGRRFQESVLEVRYLGRNADDFLHMSVEECSKVFHSDSSVVKAADILCTLGLGHLTLGHPLSRLSGGEAQRLKLVPFLQEASKGRALLIFDEPTTGLHLHDVEKLIDLFRMLRDRGHSVLCVEHNLALIAASDWLIDLGPEGGDQGGYVMCEGPPLKIAAGKADKSYTRAALRDFVRNIGKKPESFEKGTAKRTDHDAGTLKITGAREHNLKNIDVEVPLGKIVALTGVSGSGKSSIAKDIIYAEGQRRFLDCLSPYARQFIKELKRPDIAEIRNVQPTICVYQHTFQPSRLSTVATMSEVYNFLRLLYAKLGVQYCPDHPDQQISPLSAAEMAAEIKSFNVSNLRILAPVVKLKKGHHNEVLNRAIE